MSDNKETTQATPATERLAKMRLHYTKYMLNADAYCCDTCGGYDPHGPIPYPGWPIQPYYLRAHNPECPFAKEDLEADRPLIARIDALQAENKRLRGLCVECRTQLSTTLTLAMLLLPFADEKITDETYNQCVAELQKSRELLDSASNETI